MRHNVHASASAVLVRVEMAVTADAVCRPLASYRLSPGAPRYHAHPVEPPFSCAQTPRHYRCHSAESPYRCPGRPPPAP
eukprot:6212219-Heterocapsa_arctica.AAC.1